MHQSFLYVEVKEFEVPGQTLKKKEKKGKKKKTKPSNLLSMPVLLCPFNTNVYFVATSAQICLVTELVVLIQA